MIHGLRALNGNQLSAVVGRVSLPVSDDGLTVSLITTYSDGHPGSAALSALHFASNGWTAAAQLNYPLLRGRAQSLWLWGGVSGKWLKSLLASTPNSQDHIYALQAGATWNERDSDGLTLADATLTQGLDVFDATTPASLLRSRQAGSGQFTSLSGTVTRLEPLVQTSQGDLDLYAAIMGQVAVARASVGGAMRLWRSHLRPRLRRQRIGRRSLSDGHGGNSPHARAGRCLVWRNSERRTTLCRRRCGPGVEHGHLGLGDKASENGATVGLGVRFGLLQYVNGSLEYDQPLGHRVALEANRSGRFFVHGSPTFPKYSKQDFIYFYF